MPSEDTEPEELEELEEFEEGRGRSKRRRHAKSFDILAMELVALPEYRCKGLPVTEKFKQSLQAARSTRSKAARRRHLRHVSGLLRESPLEVEAIRGYLDGTGYTPVTGNEGSQELEDLRSALSSEETFAQALETCSQTLVHADLALVSRLAKSLHEGEDDKAYRALFKELRRAADEGEADSGDEED